MPPWYHVHPAARRGAAPPGRQVAPHAAPEAYELIQLVVEFGAEVLEELARRDIHTAGIANPVS